MASLVQWYKDFPPGWGHIAVPLSSRRGALAALALYSPCRGKGLWAQRAASFVVRMLGPRALLGRSFQWRPTTEWRALSEVLRRELGEFSEVAGYRRVQASRGGLALLLLRHGLPIAFVKLRQGDGGQLASEWRALDAVCRYQPRAFRVAEPLRFGSIANWYYLATAPLPSSLHRPAHHPPLEAILREVDAALSTLPRPAGTPGHWRPMHGDFAPWNLRQFDGGPLVLVDWEDAGWAPPRADEVFYRATRAALWHGAVERCDAPETVRFWQGRVLAQQAGNDRDWRLAKALGDILSRMAEG